MKPTKDSKLGVLKKNNIKVHYMQSVNITVKSFVQLICANENWKQQQKVS
jgi:hypothetical protein